MQTLLVFVGIPAGIIFLIFLAVYGKSMTRQPNRYRPGKPWDYPPSWYVPHPDAVVHAPSELLAFCTAWDTAWDTAWESAASHRTLTAG